jgi:hypothetical protein
MEASKEPMDEIEAVLKKNREANTKMTARQGFNSKYMGFLLKIHNRPMKVLLPSEQKPMDEDSGVITEVPKIAEQNVDEVEVTPVLKAVLVRPHQVRQHLLGVHLRGHRASSDRRRDLSSGHAQVVAHRDAQPDHQKDREGKDGHPAQGHGRAPQGLRRQSERALQGTHPVLSAPGLHRIRGDRRHDARRERRGLLLRRGQHPALHIPPQVRVHQVQRQVRERNWSWTRSWSGWRRGAASTSRWPTRCSTPPSRTAPG